MKEHTQGRIEDFRISKGIARWGFCKAKSKSSLWDRIKKFMRIGRK
jgi:hypothetical protein